MTRINYRSDFTLTLRFRDREGREVTPPLSDWEARFSTPRLNGQFRCGVRNGVPYNCTLDEDCARVQFDGHGLGPGELQCRFSVSLPDNSFPDGARTIASTLNTGITLCTDEPDEVAPPCLLLALPFSGEKIRKYIGTAQFLSGDNVVCSFSILEEEEGYYDYYCYDVEGIGEWD